MILLLACLRWISLAIWIANIVRLAPPARRALSDRCRYLDPIWAVIWGLALNRAWFVGRDIYYHPAPGIVEAGSLVVGYMTAAALALGIFRLRGAYGD